MMAHHYRIHLHWSEPDKRWLAEVPALPGCLADGTTQEDALAHAEVAIKEWIEVAQLEGRPIPEPLDRADFSAMTERGFAFLERMDANPAFRAVMRDLADE